jgi:hypothetical protein
MKRLVAAAEKEKAERLVLAQAEATARCWGLSSTRVGALAGLALALLLLLSHASQPDWTRQMQLTGTVWRSAGAGTQLGPRPDAEDADADADGVVDADADSDPDSAYAGEGTVAGTASAAPLGTSSRAWDVRREAWATSTSPAELEELLTVHPDLVLPEHPVACLQPDRYLAFGAQYKALNFSLKEFRRAHRSMPNEQLYERCTVVHAAHKLKGFVPANNLAPHLAGGLACASGSKAVQYACRRRAADADGCRIEDFGVMPRSFSLSERSECGRFLLFAKSAEFAGTYWLEKPTKFDSHGRGQRLLAPDDIAAWLAEHDCDKPRPAVMVQYVTDPLTLRQRKIDLRTYALIPIADPLLVFGAEGSSATPTSSTT